MLSRSGHTEFTTLLQAIATKLHVANSPDLYLKLAGINATIGSASEASFDWQLY